MDDYLINCVICRKACFKGWIHDEIVAGNVAEVEWKSTPEMLQAMQRCMQQFQRRPHGATISPIVRNIACSVASCGRAFNVFHSSQLQRNLNYKKGLYKCTYLLITRIHCLKQRGKQTNSQVFMLLLTFNCEKFTNSLGSGHYGQRSTSSRTYIVGHGSWRRCRQNEKKVYLSLHSS